MANDDFEERPTALVVLLPAADDPVNAASSEDIAHMTFVWFGDVSDGESEDGTAFDEAAIRAELEAYAAETTPITVPVRERGELGDDSADVLFMEGTDALMALRAGIVGPGDEGPTPIRDAHDATTQYPEWTPHVTLGYPDVPAEAEYAGDQITFDRFALWIGNERTEYPMGAEAIAAAAELPDDPTEEVEQEVIDDPAEPLVDEPVDEIPVHGVATIIGRPTGDGRMFATGGITIAPMPQPLGFEFESSHGGGNSRVSIVGRIDEMWIEGEEVRYNGVIIPTKPYANLAIEGLIDGSLTGVSVKVDDVALDVSEERERVKANLQRERDDTLEANLASDEADVEQRPVMSDEEIDELVDAWVGDGTMPTTTFAAARIRNFDIVAFQAYVDAWVALGHWDEIVEVSEDEAAALAACGCIDGPVDGADHFWGYDLTELSATQLAEYDALEGQPHAQRAYMLESHPEAILAGGQAFAPGTKDGPGWITHPRATARIRRYWVSGPGAKKIAWGTPGDFNRCRTLLAEYVQNPEWLAGLCANMHKEALGIWPAQHHGALQPLTASGRAPIAIIAAAPKPLPAEFFRRPDVLDEHSGGILVDGDHVYGYVAEWGVCHIGIEQVCTTAPHSTTGYAYFATGYVTTTEGEVRVGQITMDTGHASMKASSRAAAAHYDNTGAAVADIAIGEDTRGIWFSGMFRPSATEEQRHALKASGRLSGDWRDWGMPDLELVAALAVNVPGFPIQHTGIAASGGRQTALIAAGIVGEAEAIVAAAAATLDAETVAEISRAAVAEYVSIQDRRARIAATAELRQGLRTQRIEAMRAGIERRS